LLRLQSTLNCSEQHDNSLKYASFYFKIALLTTATLERLIVRPMLIIEHCGSALLSSLRNGWKKVTVIRCSSSLCTRCIMALGTDAAELHLEACIGFSGAFKKLVIVNSCFAIAALLQCLSPKLQHNALLTSCTFTVTIGFAGGVLGGLKVTPCGNYTVYPLGKILIVRSLVGGKTAFLEGHTNDVCCVAMSPDGRKLATGQMNHAGVKADVCVWDLNQAIKNCDNNEPHGGGALIKRLRQHLGKVQGLDFRYA
jgi:WD40 repeat protein